ncbi:signal transduction histidine kinase [Clostridium tetanomorphum]|uniref:HAMP domain-containing sensor histidine kinase n=1 Tax=Clostridium tetanomorphum TaxID=1553 RepID=UPI00044CADCF|nr:HAMP domain-containing sensor histidine kinase [Clostridium tetanomorphum]KAJ51986.1 two-component sensor histidine kinase [Clostridium tetanomorphum DSM 665]MBP1862906.1 signal transduction histidine kinase [Clostridium tetanomorphum]NRS87043.1 signal transduction histidine kinase [Clostridium tetanomorphum]
MIEKLSLKKQFIISFIAIIITSMLLSFMTYTVELFLISKNVIYPSNYYEKQIPDIEKKINEKGIDILNKNSRKYIESIVPLQGIEYIVLDNRKYIIYNTYEKDLRKYIKNNNRPFAIPIGFQKGARFIPIKEKEQIKGWIILTYNLKPSVENQFFNRFVQYMDVIIIMMPFLYICITTYIFSKKLHKRIITPLNELKAASHKVKNGDLDFSINYSNSNELGELCESFEEMRKELKNSLDAKWQMERERKESTSAIAHDLKTPLTIINGHVELLLENENFSKDFIKKYLQVIKDNTDRANKLIEKINTLAKVDSVQFNLNYEKVNLKKYINTKYNEYKLLCNNKKIKLNLNIEDRREKEKNFNIDICVLSEILDNIVVNSIRFTDNNGEIYLDLVIDENKINFKIEDTGKGFSKEDIKNLFKIFYQGDKSRSKEKGHSGLGLHICEKLVKKHGGEIKAYNSEKGAVVEFYIDKFLD